MGHRYFIQPVSLEGTDTVESIGVWYENDDEILYQYSYIVDTGEEIEFSKCDMDIYPEDEEISEEEAKKIMQK